MTELGYNSLDAGFTGTKNKNMHCTNPHCFDDTCQGECIEEECCDNDCDCHD